MLSSKVCIVFSFSCITTKPFDYLVDCSRFSLELCLKLQKRSRIFSNNLKTRTLRANVGKYRESQISFKNSNFGWYHPNIPLGELFQEMILRNPQALYILRILEKFENSQKIHLLIRETGANFNIFQRNSTSAQKLLLTWYYSCI